MTPHMKLDEKAVVVSLAWLADHIRELKRTPNRFADDIYGLEQIYDLLSAAHAPQGGVRVRPLAWKYYPATNVGVEEWVASGACDFHAIVQRSGDGWHLLGSPEVGDLDGRKATAQADYEASIRAALTGSDPQ